LAAPGPALYLLARGSKISFFRTGSVNWRFLWEPWPAPLFFPFLSPFFFVVIGFPGVPLQIERRGSEFPPCFLENFFRPREFPKSKAGGPRAPKQNLIATRKCRPGLERKGLPNKRTRRKTKQNPSRSGPCSRHPLNCNWGHRLKIDNPPTKTIPPPINTGGTPFPPPLPPPPPRAAVAPFPCPDLTPCLSDRV